MVELLPVFEQYKPMFEFFDDENNDTDKNLPFTEEWLEADKRKYVRDYSLPRMASGLIGFKKSGEGYESIRVPAPKQGEISSGVVSQAPQLEDGQ